MSPSVKRTFEETYLGQLRKLGFAAGRNSNSEEERSHSGLMEWLWISSRGRKRG